MSRKKSKYHSYNISRQHIRDMYKDNYELTNQKDHSFKNMPTHSGDTKPYVDIYIVCHSHPSKPT